LTSCKPVSCSGRTLHHAVSNVGGADERLALQPSPSGRRIAAAFPCLQQQTEVTGRRLKPKTDTAWRKDEVINKSDVGLAVHRNSVWIRKTNWMSLFVTSGWFILSTLINKCHHNYWFCLRIVFFLFSVIEIATPATVRSAVLWFGDAVVFGGLGPTFQGYLLPPSSEHFSFIKV